MEINNCNCGGEGKVFIHTLPIDSKEIYYEIYCDKCGIRTPSSQSLREVLEKWNNVMERKYKIEYVPCQTQTNCYPSYSQTITTTVKGIVC